MKVQFQTVDVFTDRQFGGNPVAVIPDAARPFGRANAGDRE
jgi:predicted PhzF superfamily epimerase YddE/YHI9